METSNKGCPTIYPICNLCEKMDLFALPAWESMLYICQFCPKRQAVLKRSIEEKKADAVDAQPGRIPLKCRG